MDGTLDVRTLWLSNSTIRIGVARGGGGRVGWRARGQLTRCFSAVAELLVTDLLRTCYGETGVMDFGFT